MILRISSYFFLLMLFIAFFLAFMGVQQITFGDSYLIFLRDISTRYNNWHFEIPKVPKIGLFDLQAIDSSGGILQLLSRIANFFINVFNLFIGVLNITITIFNIIISVIQFVLTLLTSFKEWRNFLLT